MAEANEEEEVKEGESEASGTTTSDNQENVDNSAEDSSDTDQDGV